MKNVMIALCFAAFVGAPIVASAADKDPYHVMWTNAKGEQKCSNKGSQEKAERCASKMREKGKASNVQVMAGTCKSM